jgi:hypothetical protein
MGGANGVLDRVVGGWSVGGILTWTTGVPFYIAAGRATFNSGTANNGAQLVGISLDNFQKNVGIFKTPAGVFFINPNLLDTTIDPKHPEALVYRPKANGALKLAALEYIVFKQAWQDAKGANAPAPSLFGKPFLLSPEPNRFGIPAFYALHAWVWKDNPTGTFQPWNPKIKCPSS